MSSQITVAGLAVTAVKGARLREVAQVELDELGARGDRSFCVIDDRGRMLNGKQLGELQRVVADYAPVDCIGEDDGGDPAGGGAQGGELSLSFPGGEEIRGPVQYDGSLQIRFFSRTREAHLLRGPWSEALSEYTGQSLRLVAPGVGVDRGRQGGVSVISRASLQGLAEVADRESVDARRFRMLMEVDGVGAHAEDRWVGGRARIGSSRLRFHGHVGRCLVTSRNPESGEVDLPTLELLGEYRRDLDATEPLPFGIYGQVLEPGVIRVGDAVELER